MVISGVILVKFKEKMEMGKEIILKKRYLNEVYSEIILKKELMETRKEIVEKIRISLTSE